MDDLVDVFSSG
jgi:hypothetical protein